MGILGHLVGFDPSGPSQWGCWVFDGFSIFGNAFSTAFGVSHGFVTSIKGYRMTDSFMSLTDFEFSMDVYG